MRLRLTVTVLAAAGVELVNPAAASADFGSLQRQLFRGAEYAGNHTLLSNPQGGPLYDYNLFRQRIEYNRAAQGYTYESYRFFGPDSFGNPNTLDLGPFKIELGLDPSISSSTQPIGIHSRIGYTTRFIPEVFVDAETGQRGYNVFSGQTSFSSAPVNYRITLNTGIQDFEWAGNASVDMGGRLNAMGFYDFQLRFTNVGNYEAGGLFVQDEQVNDFDVGPIDVSGNIMFDLLAGALQLDGGAAGAAASPRIQSGAAQRQKTEELLARLDAGEELADSEMRYLAQEMFRTAFIADPLAVMNGHMPSEVPGFERFSLSLQMSGTDGSDVAAPSSDLVPEPGTLALLGTVAATLAALRPISIRRPRRRGAAGF